MAALEDPAVLVRGDAPCCRGRAVAVDYPPMAMKENIGFQWSWWVPERPESGPRGHRNTPRAASEDQMDSWEVPGERPEAVWRRFGSSRGAFEAFSESLFLQKNNYL